MAPSHALAGHPHSFCRNRHCPKCQAAASRRWLADREAELLPVPYFHVVYTPSELRDIAYQNKRVVYDLLMKAAAETTLAIAADPKRLGARIGVTAVLHTWGSALTHHPHVHMIVPGGGFSLDKARWVASRSNFLVHVNVLARLFRGKMLAMLMDAHDGGQLTFFNTHAELAEKRTFKRFIAALRRIHWVVHCKAPFAGPEQVLRYLSRYTHRVAISNRRLVCRRQHQHRVPLQGLSHQRPRPLEDDAASPARVYQALPDARAAQGLPPNPTLYHYFQSFTNTICFHTIFYPTVATCIGDAPRSKRSGDILWLSSLCPLSRVPQSILGGPARGSK